MTPRPASCPAYVTTPARAASTRAPGEAARSTPGGRGRRAWPAPGSDGSRGGDRRAEGAIRTAPAPPGGERTPTGARRPRPGAARGAAPEPPGPAAREPTTARREGRARRVGRRGYGRAVAQGLLEVRIGTRSPGDDDGAPSGLVGPAGPAHPVDAGIPVDDQPVAAAARA